MDIPGYQIERELGRGGMAIVYLARQVPLGRPVAIKIMALALAADKSFPERFLKEGQIIAQLDHPNIVRVFDLGTHQDIYYLSMEYLAGGTLEQRIEQGLSVEDTVGIIVNVAKALGYAHGQGIVHRDIKPQNILFRKDGSPVLTDFGIARFVDGTSQLTAPGLAMGSPLYMSPERVAGKKTDARSDLYSLGVLFYQMLTTKMPYEADDPVAIIMMHCTAPLPVLPREFRRLQPILDRLLAKKPEGRFDSAEELIQALRAFESKPARKGAETELVSEIPTRLALPRASRPSWLTASLIRKGLAAGVLLAATGAGFYLISNQGPPPPTEGAETEAKRVAEAEAKRVAEAEAKRVAEAEAKRREQAGKLFADANKLYAEKKYEESIKLIEEIIWLKPDYLGLDALKRKVQEALALQKKNSELLAKAQGEQSYKLFLQVLELDPNNTDAKAGLKAIGDNYYQRAKQFLDQGKPEDSQKLLDELSRFSRFLPDYPNLPDLQQQIKARLTKQSEVQNLLGRAERQLKDQNFVAPDNDNAYDSYQKVLKLEEENSKAWEGLTKIASEYYQIPAQELAEKNKLPESLDLIEKGLQKFQGHPGLQALRDKVQSKQRAETEYNQQATATLDEARALFNAGKLEESLQRIADGLRVVPDHAELLKFKGEIEQKINANYTFLAEISKLLNQAQDQFNKGKLDDALKNYRKVLEKDSKNEEAKNGLQAIADAYQKRAEELFSQNELTKAKDIIDKGLKFLPNHSGLSSLQAQVHKALTERTTRTTKNEAERQRKAERRQAEETKRRQAAEDARRQTEETKRRQAAEDARRQTEETKRRQAAEDAKRQTEDAKRRQAEAEDTKRRQALEDKRQAATEAKPDPVKIRNPLPPTGGF